MCENKLWSHGGAMVKNPPANAGDARDISSIPGLGRSPGVGNGNHSSILAWQSSWMEEPGRLQSKGPQELGTTELLNMHA